MRIWFDVVLAAAGAWSWQHMAGLSQVLAEVSGHPSVFQDLSATAILAGLLWFVMRELRVAVDRQAEAISKLKDSLDGWESTLRDLLHDPETHQH